MPQSSCQFCGAPLTANAGACPACGQPVPTAETPAPEVPESYIAPPEASPPPIKDAVTEDSWTSVPSPSGHDSGPQKKQKTGSSLRIILIAIIVLVVVCCCCLVLAVWALYSNVDINLDGTIYQLTWPVVIFLM